MGKGYQTSSPQFLDFIYKPNFDVAMKLADSQVKEHYTRSKLLNSVPDLEVETWNDAHGDVVNAERQKYEDKIQDLTNRMVQSKEPGELNKLMPELNKVRRELKDSYTKGTFYTAQESAKNHKKFLENLEKIKDPTARERYKQEYEGKYLAEGADRSQVFTPGVMMDTKNLGDMFFKSSFYKNLPPDKKSKFGVENKDGLRVQTSFDQTIMEDETIQNAYKQFIESEPGMKDYAKHRQKVFNEQFLDENEDYDWSENGILGNQRQQMGRDYSYKNTANYRQNISVDPFSEESKNMRMANNLAAVAKLQGLQGGLKGPDKVVGIKTNKLYEASTYYQDEKKKVLDRMATGLAERKIQKDQDEIETFILANKTKYPSLYKDLKKTLDKINDTHVASIDAAAELIGEKNAIKLFKQVEAFAPETTWFVSPEGVTGELTESFPLNAAGFKSLPKDVQANILGIDLSKTGARLPELYEVKVKVAKATTGLVPLPGAPVEQNLIRLNVDINGVMIPVYKEAGYFLNSNLKPKE